MSDRAIRQALRWKNDFAERTDADIYIVTQFCFEADPIIEWDKRLRMEGNRLPIHIGIPGLATIKTLMGYAKACGIGPSMRFISRQAMNVAKLLVVSTPNKLVAALAAYKATDPDCGIVAAHMLPLGGLKKSADWSYAVVNGRFSLSSDATEFKVN
jgi:methylenetetrahydrofolate reductase (NADPH)